MALALALASGAGSIQAAPLRPPQADAARLERQLDRLLVVGNALYVAAHPDDENTKLLAWLQNAALLHAVYLSITRGDGGQNLVGRELGAPLGLIRTQELLAARGVDGAEQLFTRARDFGYSKSPEESLAIWGHEAVLADTVLAIRRVRPDVIFTRFQPEGSDTHGHHTASARLALEAFEKAADPAYLPDEAHRALGPWKAKRIVWNQTNWSNAAASTFAGLPQLDAGGYDPWLGLSYGELAADSRSMHKSQGFGAARRRGPSPEYFKLLAGDAMVGSPFDGIVSDWSRVPGSAKLVAALQQARASFKNSAPEAAIPGLLAARAELLALAENPWKAAKLQELEQALLGCAGLWAEVVADQAATWPGGKLPVTITALLRRPAAQVLLAAARLPGKPLRPERALREGDPVELKEELPIPDFAPVSNPVWLDLPATAGLYPVREPRMAGLPEGPPALEAELDFTFGNQTITARRPVVFKWVDPVLGERYRAVEVLPAVTLEPGSPLLVFPDAQPRPLTIALASAPGASGTVTLEAPAGFTFTPSEAKFTVSAGGEVHATFTVTPPRDAATGVLRAVAKVGTQTYARSLRRIEHAHIPIQTWLPPAEVRLVRAEVLHSRRRLGYVPGPGDDVPEALRQAGYQVTMLPMAALREQDLAGFEAIVVGVRAHNTEPVLQALHPKLMAYVEGGGTLVLQYLTNNWFNAAPPKLGPYPLAIGRGRVTDEEAAVEAAPDPVLQGPNPIGPADWLGWVQERGLYFAETWDDNYRAPLAMHDAGEKPLRGSLLIGKFGKGTFVYTGLAFFRQLPAGVPGAFRLFANLIDAGAPPATAPAAHKPAAPKGAASKAGAKAGHGGR